MIPRNIIQLCFCTSPFQIPELVPRIPKNHDIRVANVHEISLDAIKIGDTWTIIFGLLWWSMLPIWVIGGIFYRTYMKSTFIFTFPLLFAYSREILDSGPAGIKADHSKLLTYISLIASLSYIALSIAVPAMQVVSRDSLTENPTLPILVYINTAASTFTAYFPIASFIIASITILSLLFGQAIIVDDDVPARAAIVEKNIKIYQVAINVKNIFAYFNYLLIGIYALLWYFGHTQIIKIESHWTSSIITAIYGKYARSLLMPV